MVRGRAEEAVAQSAIAAASVAGVAGFDDRSPCRRSEPRRRRSRRRWCRRSPCCPGGRARRALRWSGRAGRRRWRSAPAPGPAPPSAPRRRSPPAQSSVADQGHRRRPLSCVGRGEDRQRHAGGVGCGVGAADPGRVAGREGGVAELLRRSGSAARSDASLSARGAGAGAGPALPASSLEPPLPPSMATTMKTIATRTRAAITFSAPGIGLRAALRLRRGGRGRAAGGCPAPGSARSPARRGLRRLLFGGVEPGSPAAGTSALIGRSALTGRNATWGADARTRSAGWPFS